MIMMDIHWQLIQKKRASEYLFSLIWSWGWHKHSPPLWQKKNASLQSEAYNFVVSQVWLIPRPETIPGPNQSVDHQQHLDTCWTCHVSEAPPERTSMAPPTAFIARLATSRNNAREPPKKSGCKATAANSSSVNHPRVGELMRIKTWLSEYPQLDLVRTPDVGSHQFFGCEPPSSEDFRA
jgi:hypothetical protein